MNHRQREYIVTLRDGSQVVIVASSSNDARLIVERDWGKVFRVVPGRRLRLGERA